MVEGTMRFLAGEEWIEAPRGSFLRIAAGVTHDFENRSDARSGVLNVFIPGGFEAMMPRLVAWAAEQAAAKRRRRPDRAVLAARVEPLERHRDSPFGIVRGLLAPMLPT